MPVKVKWSSLYYIFYWHPAFASHIQTKQLMLCWIFRQRACPFLRKWCSVTNNVQPRLLSASPCEARTLVPVFTLVKPRDGALSWMGWFRHSRGRYREVFLCKSNRKFYLIIKSHYPLCQTPRLPPCLRGGAGGAPQCGHSLLVLVMLPRFPLYHSWRKNPPELLRASCVRCPTAQCPGTGASAHSGAGAGSIASCGRCPQSPARRHCCTLPIFHLFLAEGRRCRLEAGSVEHPSSHHGCPSAVTAVGGQPKQGDVGSCMPRVSVSSSARAGTPRVRLPQTHLRPHFCHALKNSVTGCTQ